MVELPAVPKANHTLECVEDCKYFYGSSGSIIDARDGARPAERRRSIGNWKTASKDQGVTAEQLPPHARAVARDHDDRLPAVHGHVDPLGGRRHARRARRCSTAAPPPSSCTRRAGRAGGTDDLVLIGGEKNFTGRCENNNSEFSTYSAKAVNAGTSDEFEGPLDQIVPAGNGVYADGKPVAGALGCSVHWFQEHPTFHNGGLVALSQYENGVRFEQVGSDGSIKEVGFFIAAGSSSSSPKWAPDGKTVYSIDYQRGIDILRYDGDTFVPDPVTGKARHQKGRVRASRTEAADARRAMARLPRVSQAPLLRALRAQGWVPGYCRLVAQGKLI